MSRKDNTRDSRGSKARRIKLADDEFTSMKKAIKLLLPHLPPDDLLELQRMIHQELRHYTNAGTDDRCLDDDELVAKVRRALKDS